MGILSRVEKLLQKRIYNQPVKIECRECKAVFDPKEISLVEEDSGIVYNGQKVQQFYFLCPFKGCGHKYISYYMTGNLEALTEKVKAAAVDYNLASEKVRKYHERAAEMEQKRLMKQVERAQKIYETAKTQAVSEQQRIKQYVELERTKVDVGN